MRKVERNYFLGSSNVTRFVVPCSLNQKSNNEENLEYLGPVFVSESNKRKKRKREEEGEISLKRRKQEPVFEQYSWMVSPSRPFDVKISKKRKSNFVDFPREGGYLLREPYKYCIRITTIIIRKCKFEFLLLKKEKDQYVEDGTTRLVTSLESHLEWTMPSKTSEYTYNAQFVCSTSGRHISKEEFIFVLNESGSVVYTSPIFHLFCKPPKLVKVNSI